ncbi:hypothetical protein SLEP1_g47956 [Rubroshorea leprosula]|uniref:Uncharacterized protein n=1 Tax=Rubroshorea leprosula TaxID=152421 RepID=A0AAV5LT52_9ROSI|nr:hypothetical protein SLEP1_g47956 [Rubroshorea leprosula]
MFDPVEEGEEGGQRRSGQRSGCLFGGDQVVCCFNSVEEMRSEEVRQMQRCDRVSLLCCFCSSVLRGGGDEN